jgi:CRP-like cAMP-binding protein
MRGGAKPKVRKLKEGAQLVRENEVGDDLFLLLDGVLRAEKDGERLEEYGPGALLGERAALEGGRRTATLVAVTKCKVAVASARDMDHATLHELSGGHRHEENGS